MYFEYNIINSHTGLHEKDIVVLPSMGGNLIQKPVVCFLAELSFNVLKSINRMQD